MTHEIAVKPNLVRDCHSNINSLKHELLDAILTVPTISTQSFRKSSRVGSHRSRSFINHINSELHTHISRLVFESGANRCTFLATLCDRALYGLIWIRLLS